MISLEIAKEFKLSMPSKAWHTYESKTVPLTKLTDHAE